MLKLIIIIFAVFTFVILDYSLIEFYSNHIEKINISNMVFNGEKLSNGMKAILLISSGIVPLIWGLVFSLFLNSNFISKLYDSANFVFINVLGFPVVLNAFIGIIIIYLNDVNTFLDLLTPLIMAIGALFFSLLGSILAGKISEL